MEEQDWILSAFKISVFLDIVLFALILIFKTDSLKYYSILCSKRVVHLPGPLPIILFHR